MAGKGSERKGKKDNKSTAASSELGDALTAFTLPDSLPCSEIEFPILTKRVYRAQWDEIVRESDQALKEIAVFVDSRREIPIPSPFLDTETDYIKNEVFNLLIPAVEETLDKAKIWEACYIQKCFFNGIDHIVQLLWNNNPRYPKRKLNNLHVFNMPWVRDILKENPRPYYPKSWLWPEDYAATLIQKTVRQYFVQREEEVQEMRDFWKKLELEQHMPEIDTNPYLSRKFASAINFRKSLSK